MSSETEVWERGGIFMKRFSYALILSAMLGCAASAEDSMSKSLYSGWTIGSVGVLLHGKRVMGSEARVTHIFDSDYFIHPVIDASVTDQGGIWLGAGIYLENEWDMQTHKMFVGASFEPGAYFKGSEYDLGYPLEFRSGIEAGFKTPNGYRISVIYDHRSNAGISNLNPGVETLQLRIGKHFN